jgi:hypothetical protein|tara:strand:- start:129 stop:281 length:153 start_codon:yes stop_codon:yes gene_type:complete
MRKGFNGTSVQLRRPQPKPPNTDARQPRPASPEKPTLMNVKKEKIKITFD